MRNDYFNYKELASKHVPDSDGFLTDYTLYQYTPDDGDVIYFCVFGDKDMYRPISTDDIDYADFETENYDEAVEWFESYRGFEDDDDVYASKKIAKRKSAIVATSRAEHDKHEQDVLRVLKAHGYDINSPRVMSYANYAAEMIDNADDPDSYTAEEWYKDTLENYFEELAALSSSAQIAEIKEYVRSKVHEIFLDAIESADDNLAWRIHEAVPEYDVDWCSDFVAPREEYARNNAINRLVDATVDILFGES